MVKPRQPGQERTVTLRDERQGRDSRHLWAYLDEQGSLRPSGQGIVRSTGVLLWPVPVRHVRAMGYKGLPANRPGGRHEVVHRDCHH